MSGADELYPPAQYGWGWILLAIGIIALVILAGWLIVFLTRPKRSITIAGAAPIMPPTSDVLSMLRTEYSTSIDRIEAAYRDGAIDAREANLELSRSIRSFVNEYSGLEAPVLALDDLVRLGVQPELIDAIHRHYYPSIFRRGTAIDPHAGAEAARAVLEKWH
ncbi:MULTISPECIES: hypothetical protein [unclassified Microbacterium]|uniref:hypothetical protein n=1 Tax=unclassified Microbacterium TaxID=2609290 RepID=UPI001E050ACE|nr:MULTISPECIES: hypothetical protein [unclassified Microbacterium]CAH0210204.1 hypothetical protein SRABI121_02706 [Microbacterium sp. Bi121]HWK78392.1 hypothetical protein [Microbacterium sp.]